MWREHPPDPLNSRLETYLASHVGRPFKWGENDCWTMVRGWLAETGAFPDFLAKLNSMAGTYSDPVTIYRRGRKAGIEPCPLVLGLLGKVLPAHMCSEGAIAIVPMSGNKGYRMGLVDGNGAVAGLTKQGLVREVNPEALGVNI